MEPRKKLRMASVRGCREESEGLVKFIREIIYIEAFRLGLADRSGLFLVLGLARAKECPAFDLCYAAEVTDTQTSLLLACLRPNRCSVCRFPLLGRERANPPFLTGHLRRTIYGGISFLPALSTCHRERHPLPLFSFLSTRRFREKHHEERFDEADLAS